MRQPIESFFKWLIDKTAIQRASQVRSTEGLIIHCLGKMTFALFLLRVSHCLWQWFQITRQKAKRANRVKYISLEVSTTKEI
jgi:hypothetical protein